MVYDYVWLRLVLLSSPFFGFSSRFVIRSASDLNQIFTSLTQARPSLVQHETQTLNAICTGPWEFLSNADCTYLSNTTRNSGKSGTGQTVPTEALKSIKTIRSQLHTTALVVTIRCLSASGRLSPKRLTGDACAAMALWGGERARAISSNLN